MSFRDIVSNNFKWKLGALSMAMFVWFIIQIALAKGCNPADHPLSDVRTRIFFRQPVLVITEPGDPQRFKVTPAKVDITIRSTSTALNKMTEKDLRAFVSLAGEEVGPEQTKEVLIFVPNTVELDSVKVDPLTVNVVRLTQPE